VNTQDVVTRVRRTFGDDAAVQVTDADVIRWINDSQIEIVKNNDSALQATTTMSLVANQSEYALPVDLLILRSLKYKFASHLSFTNLRYQNMQQFDETVDGWDGTLYGSGSPVYFTMYDEKMILFPPPQEASAGGLKLLYNQKPVDVVGLSDALALPLIYHNTVVNYCLWQASLMDEDHEPALMYRSSFDDDLIRLKDRETKDPVATYPVITVRQEDAW
jgi:hypothetical protein